MKRKNNFFLIGMTSVLLAFAMIGCDNGTTTKTEYVNTGGGGGNNGSDGPSVTSEDRLRNALTSGAGTIYVVGDITLTDALEIPPGYTVIIPTTYPSDGKVVQSVGGPLFADVQAPANARINSGVYTLTVKPTAGLYAQKAQAVVVASGGDLVVEAGATLGSSATSGVVIAPSADTHLNKGAILAVTNTPGSIVVQQDASSSGKLTDEGSKVVIEGIDDNTTVALYAATMDDSGASIAPIVTIPAGVPANISDEVTVYASIEDASDPGNAGLSAVTNSVKGQAETASKGSPERTTSEASKVNGLFNPTSAEITAGAVAATKVTYTGTGASLGAITAPDKTLVIAGTVSAQDAAISVGTLEITATGSLTLSGAITITVETALVNDGTLDLGPNGAVSGDPTYTNNGTIKLPIPNISVLNEVLESKGTIVATAAITVAADATLTVPADTELEITGALTVNSGIKLTVAAVPATSSLSITGTITNSGTIDLGTLSSISPATITNTSGTIKTANGIVLAVLLANVEDGTIEVTDSIALTGTATLKDSTTLKVTKDKTLNVSGSLDVEDGATITAAGDEDSGTITGDVTQVVEGIELSEVESVNPEGLEIESVKKDLTTGDSNGFVTITLSGNAGNVIPAGDVYNDMFWDDANAATDTLIAEEAALGYSAVVITGLVTPGTTGKIKQVNQAFNMWKPDTPGGHPATIQDYPNPGVFKEKVYTTDADAYYPPSIGGFDIMLWGGASRKTITLEITQPYSDDDNADNDGPTKTFLIDYTDVTFTAPDA